MSLRMNYMQEIINRQILAEYKARSDHWQMCLKPKPRWIPGWVWSRLLSLILIEEVRHRTWDPLP